MEKIDICVVTYNRLVYLQKCIWSILATKPSNCRIIVGDDCSTDGTQGWLTKMHNRGIIDKILLNETNLGSFANHNKVIRSSETEYIAFVLNDFWLHRGWYEASTNIVKQYNDCGIVSFYNNTRLYLDIKDGMGEKIDDNTYRVSRSGLGASIINRELFDKSGGFPLLQGDKKWGYKATSFCEACNKVDIQRNRQYQIMPFYAYGMDVITSPLNEIEDTTEYREQRHLHKYNRPLSEKRKGE